jgi:steroid 5-alpha reductase family enzyme
MPGTAMPNEPAALLLAGMAFVCVMMAGTWGLSLRMRNAGLVDIAWSAGFTPVAIFYARYAHGLPGRRVLIATLMSLWSLRLAAHLFVRVLGAHPEEDRRYGRLRASWGPQFNRRMFAFFQLQAVLIVVLSVPILLICSNPRPHLAGIEYAGVLVWLIALAGEAVADRQLQRFKADRGNRGDICQTGLWRYSRHPNYFFEWLIWVAYFLLALAVPGGWWTVYCPLLMLYFLLRVTGIPLAEQLARERRGDAYLQYQRRTSMFVPWFRKKTLTGES